ncbi:MAG: hypothetical protein AAF694_11870 [Bacteroidota bacterium]
MATIKITKDGKDGFIRFPNEIPPDLNINIALNRMFYNENCGIVQYQMLTRDEEGNPINQHKCSIGIIVEYAEIYLDKTRLEGHIRNINGIEIDDDGKPFADLEGQVRMELQILDKMKDMVAIPAPLVLCPVFEQRGSSLDPEILGLSQMEGLYMALCCGEFERPSAHFEVQVRK